MDSGKVLYVYLFYSSAEGLTGVSGLVYYVYLFRCSQGIFFALFFQRGRPFVDLKRGRASMLP
jgi:hypothetical protein